MAAKTALKGKSELSGHEQITEFIQQSEHPLKALMKAVREVILEANP